MTTGRQRPAYSPVVYEHAARFVGKSPWEVSRSPELLVRAHAEAHRVYGHSPIMVGIDIYNLEAEAYGARVQEPEGEGIPAIAQPPLRSLREIPGLDFSALPARGRIPLFIEAGMKLRALFPKTEVRFPVSGPFSIAGNLVGLERLTTECLVDPQGVRAALRHLAEGQLLVARACAAAGIGVTLFESAASPPMIGPDVFRSVELPVLRELMRRVGEVTGEPAPCILGGDTAGIADELASTGSRFLICPGETDQRAFMEAMRPHSGIIVRVNMRPEIISAGRWEEVEAEIDRVLELAAMREQSCIGTGVLPYEADPRLVLRIGVHIRGARQRLYETE